jgi:hypothetical protein
MANIDDGFRKMLDGLKQADEGRDEVMRGLEEAWTARKDLHSELVDLRETIGELQRLVLEQGHELRQVRDRLGGER